MPPPEILERLRRSPSVLRSRDPALPERQRTLERLIDWSYDLLAPDEQAALAGSACFADGFGLAARRSARARPTISPAETSRSSSGRSSTPRS